VQRAADGVRGYRAAMMEAGLTVDDDAVERSRRIAPGDLAGMREFLEIRDSATAFIGATMERVANLAAVAEVLGLRVPEDVSVVGQGPGPIPLGKRNLRATLFRHDRKRIVTRAVDCLIEQMTTRRSAYSHVRVKPLLEEGETLAAPRETDRMESLSMWLGAPNL
jgi:DNA-binding LacI/PurR family transcriptional regulator